MARDTRQRKSRLWSWLLLGLLLLLLVLAANFAVSNPELAEQGVDAFLGLPPWAFPTIIGGAGLLVFWFGLKIESDWPEAIGALLVAASIAGGEVLIGWSHFELAGLVALPYVLPIAVFIVMLMIGLAKSR
jgi:FtsH-binding integral membrane protein